MEHMSWLLMTKKCNETHWVLLFVDKNDIYKKWLYSARSIKQNQNNHS